MTKIIKKSESGSGEVVTLEIEELVPELTPKQRTAVERLKRLIAIRDEMRASGENPYSRTSSELFMELCKAKGAEDLLTSHD